MAGREPPLPRTAGGSQREARPALVLVITASLGPTGVTWLADRVRDRLGDEGDRTVLCDVGVVNEPDIATVDALARLALTVRRLGGHVELRRASQDLRDLLSLAGLDEVLPCVPESGLEAERQPEEREELLRVEEEGDAGDLPA